MLEIWPTILSLLILTGQIILLVIPLILSVAYLVYAERRILAAMQLRRGPNVVGPLGLLQPIADALKLLHKEIIIPTRASPAIFLLAPVVTFSLSLMAWAVIPLDATMVFADINVGVLYLFAISSLGVYGVIMAGWASNSQYPFLGALRSAAQMVSYEVSIGLIIINVLICTGSMNLREIVMAQSRVWFVVPLFPLFVMFFISSLAETNRSPFDLPEAEAELVGGYNTEYSSMPFALFFLGEYANMILMSAIASLLFLGGWLPPLPFAIFQMVPGFVWFALKIAFMLFLFLWVRATLPRYRYDQLMRLGWKIFLPLSLFFVVLTSGTLLFFDMLPETGG